MACDIYFGREFNGESNVNIFRVITFTGNLLGIFSAEFRSLEGTKGPVQQDQTRKAS